MVKGERRSMEQRSMLGEEKQITAVGKGMCTKCRPLFSFLFSRPMKALIFFWKQMFFPGSHELTKAVQKV